MSCLLLQNYKMKMSRSDHTDCRNDTEKRNFSKSNTFNIVQILFLIYFMYISIPMTSAQATSCDFTGSGLDLDGSGVQPVYLSCAAGRVEWNYPRAALRLTFRYPHAKGEFHGCIKANPEFEGARLYVEGHRALIPLFSKNDGRPSDLMRCFTSHKGRISLFLEAEPSKTFKKLSASFEYDLQPMPDGDIYDPWEECRPCTGSELVQMFCSADFAAKGFITSARDDPDMKRTVITLLATKVFQQTTPVFAEKKESIFSSESDSNMSNKNLNLLSNHNFDVLWNTGVDKSDKQFRGKLYMPMQCGAKSGFGEYLFLGIRRLGEPILRCAPKLEDWKRLVESARDNSHCVLET